ncbi:hypothetical protein EX895_000682 [Sporisorium graminicola]|uniref:Chromo domain-containing protein n=1 Tax=Sporisorium graminicola TaxID=280036 RepID=A0A4U7L0F5_9BASI|nr:hypothetical protein EX895_000682 [Sporisorium graminicola]TKY90684.1 hypothetical protein EX895_000682 [Sporisorium graminicola]
MPPRPIAFDESDEDDVKYPLRSFKVPAWRADHSDSEVDELESDADDDLELEPQLPPRPSSKLARRAKREREDRDKNKKEKRRKREEKEKEEKRKRRRAEKKQAEALAARQNGSTASPSHSRTTKSPSVMPISVAPATAQRFADAHTSRVAHEGNGSSSDSDAPLPSLIIRSSTTSQPNSQPAKAQTEPMSEDEVELIASQLAGSQNTAASLTRSSSVPALTDNSQHEELSQRAVSALPHASGNSGDAANPIQLDSSDAPFQPSSRAEPVDEGDDGTISDISSVSYSDSEDYEQGEEFYTSSEGSVSDSDSERGFGPWTEYDKENWQGSTAHLDAAYNGNFDILAVLRHRQNPRRGFYEYRVVWAGYPIYSSSWEQESNFNSPTTLKEYWERQGGRPADVVVDQTEHSTHDSDTDFAVNRRPRKRAHEAKRKKRLEIRRDKRQLRQYMNSLSEERAAASALDEAKYERFRRKKRVKLETKRLQEKGSSRSYQKRQEKLNQKRWRRNAAAGGSYGTAGISRIDARHANRTLADISMKARSGAAAGINSAHTRVSQLNDSIPESDEHQMTFRRSGPSYPGLDVSMAHFRDDQSFSSQTARPTVRPQATTTALPGALGSVSTSQVPAPRPAPGSYKGAHRREPKVQLKEDFGSFLKKIHGAGGGALQRSTNVNAAQSSQAPSDSNGRSIAVGRRPSEARKPNLLVLKPVEDFKGGSRPAPPATMACAGSSASSVTGDADAFGIPEMSAVRSQFNPHQEAPGTDEEEKRAQRALASILKSTFPANAAQGSSAHADPSQQVAPRSRVENRRCRPATVAWDTQDTTQVSWSPPHNGGQSSPLDHGFTMLETASNGGRSPLESSATGPNRNRHKSKVPQHNVSHLYFEFVVGHNRIDAIADLCTFEPLSSHRRQTLGLDVPGGMLYFDMLLPFAWIRDMLAGHAATPNEVMLLHANGEGSMQARSSLDQLSEQLKDLDVALLAYTIGAASKGKSSGRRDYFVAFSSKYEVDYISGIPPSFHNVCGQPYTVCIIPLQLEHQPAPSSHISLGKAPPLEGQVVNAFESSIGKKNLEDLKIGRTEIRKVKRAAQRYRITSQHYEGIRSKYNIIFLGQNPPAYEKSVLYYMVRIFEGGIRLTLNPETDAKLYKDANIGTNVFVRRAAFEEMFASSEEGEAFWLAPYLRRFKRQPRCRFWTIGFSPGDPDERVREVFPGNEGLVTFSVSSILADLLRSSMSASGDQDKEEGQLTQTDAAPPTSILCDVAANLANYWRVQLHPWVRTCFKLLADDLEPVCRALHLIEKDQEFPIDLMFDLKMKLDELYRTADVKEWPKDAINGLDIDEPTEVPEKPEELVKRIDDEVLATLRKEQLSTAAETRFHVFVSEEGKMSEEQSAGIEVMTLAELGDNECRRLARLPGN